MTVVRTAIFLLLTTLLLVVVMATTTVVHCETQPGSFDRIFIVMFENQPKQFAMLHAYFKELATVRGTNLPNYYAVTHPSQPNYVAMIAGDHFGELSDKDLDFNATMLVDLMEKRGLTWRAYQENYPVNTGGRCFTKTSSEDGLYKRKHNPFMSFVSVSRNDTRCSRHIVNSEQLYVDIERGELPHLMYYTPNINNDGHDTGLKYANEYLSKLMPPLLGNPKFMNGTLIVVTFDEDNYLFGNNVYCALLGPMVKPGGVDEGKYTHYSLLRTIEDNFQLGTLGRHDASATSFNAFHRQNKYKDFL